MNILGIRRKLVTMFTGLCSIAVIQKQAAAVPTTPVWMTPVSNYIDCTYGGGAPCPDNSR